jgi:hypothetical protein
LRLWLEEHARRVALQPPPRQPERVDQRPQPVLRGDVHRVAARAQREREDDGGLDIAARADGGEHDRPLARRRWGCRSLVQLVWLPPKDSPLH